MRHGWKTRSSFPYKGLSTDQLVKLGTISLFFYGGTNTSIFCSCFYFLPPPSTGELMYWFFFHLACEKKQLFQLFHFNVILHFTIYLFHCCAPTNLWSEKKVLSLTVRRRNMRRGLRRTLRRWFWRVSLFVLVPGDEQVLTEDPSAFIV